VRALPDPAPSKIPACVKKALEKTLSHQDGHSIRGHAQEQPSGRSTQTETIIVPAPVHSVRPLVAREIIGNCRYCQHPLRENPKLNVMVNEKDRLHSTCFLTKIILESDGDLQAASHLWNIPLEALQQRAIRLVELGKLGKLARALV